MTPNENDILLYTLQDGVAIITLNRPKAYNALSVALTNAIIDSLKKISKDDEVKAIVLTGNGKAFSVGVDLKELETASNMFAEMDDLNKAIKNLNKPLIGAINGYAMTGGLELALCCDILYASENAIFADTHTKVGVIPGWGMTQRLPRIVGVARAKEMSLAGQKIDAETALSWGLVNRVFPADELLPAALKLASDIAGNNQTIVQGVYHLIDHGINLSLDEAIAYENVAAHSHNDSLNVSGMSDKLNQLRGKK